MRVQHQSAFLIHHYNYRESSLIAEFFTRDHGRIAAIAKGARRGKSKRRALLNSFSPLLIGWSGKGDLAVLTAIEAQGLPVKLDAEELYCGFYVNELLKRLLHRHDSHPVLFEGYRKCLVQLGDAGGSDAALRLFENLLLNELGYGLVLDHDVNDNTPIVAEARYEYILDNGPHRLKMDDKTTRGIIVHGESLIALAKESLKGRRTLKELKHLMRAMLNRILGGQPLESRRLMQALVQRSGQTPARY